MLKNILELLTVYKELAVTFNNYEQACMLLKFLEDNTDIVWVSGDKPTVFSRCFERADCYLIMGSRLAKKKYVESGYLKLYKCSDLFIEPPKCLKRL